MQSNYSYQHSLLVQEHKKLDRDFQEAMQEKGGIEEEYYQLSHNYELL